MMSRMWTGVISGAGLIIAGGAMWVVTGAAARGRLARNPWAGIRTISTQASDAAWLAGHRAALATCRITGAASLVIAVAMMINGSVDSVIFWILFALGYGGILLSAIVSIIQANRAARAAVSGQR